MKTESNFTPEEHRLFERMDEVQISQYIVDRYAALPRSTSATKKEAASCRC